MIWEKLKLTTLLQTKNEVHRKTEVDTIKLMAHKSPDFVRQELESNFHRFEKPKTKEERFAKAIDKEKV